ncbi:MAG: hypothetical protein NTV93_20880 [Verrucomicrobia bacterium]|nr:hypothetical protein [Verrucomicrobiota bacterium]
MNANGDRMTLTMEQTRKFAGGLFRFGIAEGKVINWPRIAKLANTPSKDRKWLVENGLRHGANHLEWCGTLEPVPLSECIPQVMNHKMDWEPVKETMPLENPIKTSTGFASRLRRMLGYGRHQLIPATDIIWLFGKKISKSFSKSISIYDNTTANA